MWLIAGVALLSSTALALLGTRSGSSGHGDRIGLDQRSLTGFCPVGNVLLLLGFTPMLGSRRREIST